MEPVIQKLNGVVTVVVAFPNEEQIKVNGDMYGPIMTPHPIDYKKALWAMKYGVSIKACAMDSTEDEIIAMDDLTEEALLEAVELFSMEEEEESEVVTDTPVEEEVVTPPEETETTSTLDVDDII